MKNAKGYFEEHLRAGLYYAETERIQGEWLGAGAKQLGLSGVVTEDDFIALCENKHPISGERLTQRQKSVRRDNSGAGELANRRVFYDFTFSPPKSVSIAALVVNDRRITAAHAAAVKVALIELERFAATRVRGSGQNSDRLTKNVVAALFEHHTSRALDPHLHTHCVVFNATHDDTDHRWKALQNYEMLAAQKYVENVYYHELARALRGFGYSIVNSARGDFEIAEVSPEICRRFSKRHREIDEKTRAFLAQNPQMLGRNEKDIREHIAHKARAPKRQEPGDRALRHFWGEQLEPAERNSLCIPQPLAKKAAEETSAATALFWAEEHLFERHAVVREHELWRHALAFARGATVSVSEIQTLTSSRDYVRMGDKIASRDALAREWDIVESARDGIGRYAAFSPVMGEEALLAPDQRAALASILGSTSFITLFRGGAGTGKSFVVQRLQEVLDENGLQSVVLAPQRQQVIGLARNGLASTQTVSECVNRGSIPNGAIVIVDESGQIGARQLLDLIRLTEKHNGRLILSGDTRQHGPVEASDALRAIERYSGLRAAELDEIRRQDPKRGTTDGERSRIHGYREAVEIAAAGDPAKSLQRLEEIDAVVECAVSEMSRQMTDAYLQIAESGQSVIVVSQTRAEVAEINEAIRAELRERGHLRGDECQVASLRPVDLTTAQMRDPRSHVQGDVVVFNRDFKAARRGDRVRFVGITDSSMVLDLNGRMRRVPFSELSRLTVCRPGPLSLCPGDRLQLKTNGSANDGRKLANGEVVTIVGIHASGAIRLDDGRVMPANYRQFVRGYAVTSYGSQGKTVDQVLFSDSAVRVATNAQQWYVTISRGRKGIRIFTSDKERLRLAVGRSGDRELALDLSVLPRRSRRVREQLLRGLKRGREFARRLSLLPARAWASSCRIKPYDTAITNRETNRRNHTNVLAP